MDPEEATVDIEAPPVTTQERHRIVCELMDEHGRNLVRAQAEYQERSQKAQREFMDKTSAVVEGKYAYTETGERYLPPAAQEAYLEALETEGEIFYETDLKAREEYNAKSRASYEAFGKAMQERLGIATKPFPSPPRPRYQVFI